jgi:fatty acid desaturase
MADSTTTGPPEPEMNRKRAALAVLPFLALGLLCLVLLLWWGLKPLWGFVILPPILFICVLAWIAFRSGFAESR